MDIMNKMEESGQLGELTIEPLELNNSKTDDCLNLINKSNLSDEEKEKLREEYEKVKEIRNKYVCNKLKILQMNVPTEVKAEILDKLTTIENSSHDDAKTREWIRNVLKLPFGKFYPKPLKNFRKNKEEAFIFLSKFYETLNEAVYGQHVMKETLMEIITKWLSNDDNKGNCICIEGPPGTGKTSLIREGLAKALNRPFVSFSLAGVSDENYLTGFPFTYESSTFGRFARMLIDSKCQNPIIFMDELDKVDGRKSMNVYNKLIEITDFSQNHEIEDHYFGGNVKLDLSQCIFVFSCNNSNKIDPILKDRLEIIKVKGFSSKEKIQISKKFLIPKLLKDYGCDFKFSDDIVKYIISYNKKKEEGVRDLQRSFAKIIRKMNVLKYYNKKHLTYKLKNIDHNINKEIVNLLLKEDNKIPLSIQQMYI